MECVLAVTYKHSYRFGNRDWRRIGFCHLQSSLHFNQWYKVQAAFKYSHCFILTHSCLCIYYLLALARLCYATEIPINRLVYRKEFGGKVFAIFLMLLSKRCSELLWSVLMLIGISLCSRFVIERWQNDSEIVTKFARDYTTFPVSTNPCAWLLAIIPI